MTITLSTFGQTGKNDVEGLLSIRIVSFSGASIPSGELEIKAVDGKPVFTSTVKDRAEIALMYGDYTATFTSKFFKPVRRMIKVNTNHSFLVLATEMEDVVLDVPGAPGKVSIHVHPSASCHKDGRLWARLMGVFSQYSADTEIGKEGFGLIDDVPAGEYVLVVADNGVIRNVQKISAHVPVFVVDVVPSQCSE